MSWSYDPGTTCVYGEDKLLARVTNFVDAGNKRRIGLLLAAAPDLLGALKLLVETFKKPAREEFLAGESGEISWRMACAAIEAAQNIIAKAEVK